MTKGKGVKLIDRAALLSAARLRTRQVETEAGCLLIQELSAQGRIEYGEYLELDEKNVPHFDLAKQVNFSRFIAAKVIINDERIPIFKDASEIPDDFRSDVLEEVTKQALDLSGIMPIVGDTKNPPNVSETSSKTSP